jgi:hypothetical protein
MDSVAGGTLGPHGNMGRRYQHSDGRQALIKKTAQEGDLLLGCRGPRANVETRELITVVG